MFIIERFPKIRFKNRASTLYFLEVKRSKILQKLNKSAVFVYILDFIFIAFLAQKNDLNNKYIFNFVFGSFFEQDHLLNLFNLGVYAKR